MTGFHQWHKTKRLLICVSAALFHCFAFPSVLFGASASGFDIVTMKNGDIHQGTAAVEQVAIETGIGEISVPYHQMARLEFGRKKTPDRLVTRSGEVLFGQVHELDLMMLRVLDASLPLDVADIAEIEFAARKSKRRYSPTPDAVTTINGSRFMARIHAGDLILKGAKSIHLVKPSELRFIDIASLEDGEIPRAQLTHKNGEIQQGELLIKHFKMETRYGNTLKVPLENIATLSFAVSQNNAKPDFNHRWEKIPPSLIQDRMADGSLAPEMLALDGGKFLRGDAQGDDDEKPPTAVSPGPFAIGVFEVTFEEYEKFRIDTRRDKPDDQDWGKGRRPVVNVTWEDANAYVEWLSRKTRKHYRLPTDAEWEFAARAGSTSRYWWGEETGQAKANCEGCNSLWDGEKTAPVGMFPANPLGLHDTAGNVFEWVADCWHDRFVDAPADGSAIEKPGCGKRVIRGGAWSFPPKEMRSANRWRDFPSRRSDDTGFRVARDL